MRRALLVMAVVVWSSGCGKNVDELRAARATLDRRLAELQSQAEQLITARREVAALEARLHEAEKDVPERDWPAPVALHDDAPPGPTLVLPPESTVEGPEAQRLRRQIADTQARIAALERVVREVRLLDQQRAQLEQRLKAIETRRAAADAGR